MNYCDFPISKPSERLQALREIHKRHSTCTKSHPSHSIELLENIIEASQKEVKESIKQCICFSLPIFFGPNTNTPIIDIIALLGILFTFYISRKNQYISSDAKKLKSTLWEKINTEK